MAESGAWPRLSEGLLLRPDVRGRTVPVREEGGDFWERGSRALRFLLSLLVALEGFGRFNFREREYLTEVRHTGCIAQLCSFSLKNGHRC